MSANPVANPGVTPEPAPAPAQGTPTPATPQEAPAEAPFKTFYTPKKAEKKEESAPFDVSKLSPDMQNVYKSMQGDYTRKTQELAEMRKTFESEQATLKAEREAMQRNHDALMEAIRGRTPEATPPNPEDPMSQIQALRAEGRYDEADKLMMDVVKQAALAEVAPIKQAAEAKDKMSTFTSSAMNVIATNPLVAEYRDDVLKVLDAATPQMHAIRQVMLQSPETIKFFTPLVMESIAQSIRAPKADAEILALRSQLEELKAKTNTAKARSVPARLVTSSGVSRETTGGGGGLAAALSRAETALRGA
jgi:hypothetical protein